jgi:hypothetical protein
MAKIPNKSQHQVSQLRAVQATGHLNHMAGTSYDVTHPIRQLRMVASTCFFGEPQYYADSGDVHASAALRQVNRKSLPEKEAKHVMETLGNGLTFPDWHRLTSTSMMEQVIDQALDFDPEATLQEAVRLRNEEHIRTTPQIILVRAAHHARVRGTGLVRQYAPLIIKRADEPTVQLAYHDFVYQGPVPNALKRAWKSYLEQAPALQLAKYRLENKARTLKQVVSVCHAKGDAFDKLFKGELKLDVTDSWEALIAHKGSSTETWTQAVELMGHMALLRNLRNFHQNQVPATVYVEKLVKTAEKGTQLPFRYVAAYKEVKAAGGQARVLDAIESCLKLSLKQLPTFKGRVMSLCDNSGSAQGATTSSMGSMRVADIANLTAVLTAYASEEGHIGVFGDELKTLEVRKSASILDQVEQVNKLGHSVGQGTENGVWVFFKEALKKKEHWDHLFIYSDMQAGHGGLYGVNPSDYGAFKWNGGRNIDVAALVQEYRRKVNPKVKVYLVQVAGYKDTLLPEFYKDTYILGGWGEGLLKFAYEMSAD